MIEVGTRVGKLVVTSQEETSKRGKRRWNCRCDCGTELVLNEFFLENHRVSSCGCDKETEDLTGQKYGMLTALEKAEYSCDGAIQWLCHCDCGSTVKVSVKRLKNPKNSYPHPNCGCTTNHGHKRVDAIEPGVVLDMLTVVKRIEDGIRGTKRWLVRCKCGTELIANESALLSHRIHSCGCSDEVEDIIGNRYGRLVVRERTTNYPTGQAQWICDCDCGKTKVATLAWLTRNSVEPSCGCYQAERRPELRRTHGMSKDPLYEVWASMKKRCYDENCKGYRNYGARGIYVCDRWKDSFENFYEDMHEGYEPGLQLDRIDNDGPYSPENCRWATPTENVRNRRNTHIITTALGTKPLAEQAELTGVNYGTIKDRLYRGMPEELSIIPSMGNKRLDIKAINQYLNGEEVKDEKKKMVEDIIKTAEIQAKAIDEWGFGPCEVILADNTPDGKA